jgi:small acid-soluble spore protein F (minor alpha/beta-type SASP)
MKTCRLQKLKLSRLLFSKGVTQAMPSRRPIMSERLKLELAEELGIGDIVRREGFGPVSSRNCGNLVKKAIERAEKLLAQQ